MGLDYGAKGNVLAIGTRIVPNSNFSKKSETPSSYPDFSAVSCVISPTVDGIISIGAKSVTLVRNNSFLNQEVFGGSGFV